MINVPTKYAISARRQANALRHTKRNASDADTEEKVEKKRKLKIMIKRVSKLMLPVFLLLAGCAAKEETADTYTLSHTALDLMKTYNTKEPEAVKDKYGSVYQVFVYSFCDSDGDGIGDLNGVASKLDYIQDMGFNGIWLSPVCPSDTYHKYDVKDYYAIDPVYGSMEDFENLSKECEERGIRLIFDLVINHTSSKHEWFREASSYLRTLKDDEEPDLTVCPYVAYYNFTKEHKGSSYHALSGTKWYYEAPFWGEMPDLDLRNEDVRRQVEKIVDFWMKKGVKGFRLDGVKEYVSGNPDANTEVLSWLNSYVKSKDEDMYLVAEVWMDMTGYLPYYASGIDSVFNFAFADTSGKIASSVKHSNAMTYANAITDLSGGLKAYENAIDAPFYTNHDMGRSAGYYPGDTKENKVKLAQAMNLLMTGNVFMYYGEELGMKGSGADENKRAPIMWSSDPDAAGMCKGPENMDKDMQQIFPALDEQIKDGNSIYNYICQVLRLRNAYEEIRKGEALVVSERSDKNVCVIKKTYEGESIYIAFNTAAEDVHLDIGGLGGSEIVGCLLTNDSAPAKDANDLLIPAFAAVLIK